MTDPSDYFAAKEAWEREHPGEVYTTAMHYSSGPHARVLTDYWTQFDEAAPLACAACGWEGATKDGSMELFDELFDVSCPKCDQMLLVVSYPTLEQTRAAAAAGNPAAEEERRRMEGTPPPEPAE
jgi:hypothetical protein